GRSQGESRGKPGAEGCHSGHGGGTRAAFGQPGRSRRAALRDRGSPHQAARSRRDEGRVKGQDRAHRRYLRRMSNEAVAAGRAAWARINSHGKKGFDLWIDVAKALDIGRRQCLKTAGTNRAVGSRYNRAMGAWLRENGLDGINTQERYRALQVLEKLPEIEAWRASLDEKKRRSFNHPGACWHAWKRSTKTPELPKPWEMTWREKVEKRLAVVERSAPVHWSQDSVRRAHQAMLDSRSSDLLKLARVALEAAIRCEADLLELLPAERERPVPAPGRRPGGRPRKQNGAEPALA